MKEIRLIDIKEEILSDNRGLADNLREKLSKEKVFFINIMGSPGAGKTSLILKTIESMANRYRIAVVEADIDSMVDSEKVAALGIQTVQIRTGGFCHVDASMVEKAVASLPLGELDLIILENVGNLVCPAEFDLGVDANIVVLSVTEGEDKPLKYPLMFRTCTLAILSKTDLLEVLDYDSDKAIQHMKKINPGIKTINLSAKTAAGMDKWIEYLRNLVSEKQQT